MCLRSSYSRGTPCSNATADTQFAASLTVPRWQHAEQLTDELQAPPYAALTARQRTEFAQLVNALTASPPP